MLFFWAVIFFGSLGSLSGAYINYFLAYKFGRSFFGKNSRIPFIKKIEITKIEIFFNKNGEISTLIGRLIPIIRQYISIPAGLAKMNFRKFTIYTLLGSFIWVSILTFLGYIIGNNEHLIAKYINLIILCTLTISAIIIVIYVKHKKINNKS